MNFNPVAALLRGLDVLEAVNMLGAAGLGAIQKATGIPKATTFRMLETLCSAGYVNFNPEQKTYSVTVRVLALSNNFSPDRFLLGTASPIMKELRLRLGWPSDLAIFQHDNMVIMDTNREPGAFSINRTRGSRVPIMPTAIGRAYLAFCSEEERRAIIEQLQRSDDRFEALARDTEAVARIIDETRRRGYAVSDQEYLPGNRAAAVPILNGGEVVCSINMIAAARVVSMEEVVEKHVPLLMEAKKKLEERLGGTR